MLAAFAPGMVSAKPASQEINCVAVDVGPDLRSWEATESRIAPSSEGDSYSGSGSGSAELAAEVGDTQTWMGLNDYTGKYNLKNFVLRAVGDNAEIWVAASLAWPAGDPRSTPVVTDDQVNYLLNEVDQNIYNVMTSYFTEPDFHDGTYSLLVDWGYFDPGYFSGEKMVILVDNIRDENYYFSTYPIYIAGFYSPTYEAYFDRNIITIDAVDWINRMGPSASKPFLYEGIIAHEMQHLLHSDVDPDEETFVNEGIADFAMLVCGYGPAVNNHLKDAAKYAENSLVVWEDQGGLEILSDYGQAYLWTLYLYEQFGTNFIKALFNNPDNGITGIETTLDAFNIQRNFADLYHDFSVAMLIDSMKAGGRYGFQTVDFNILMGTPSAPNTETFSTPGAAPWGTDYIWIDGNAKDLAKLTFNGADYSMYPTAWTSVDGMLWSGEGDLVDNWAIFGGMGGGTLTFDTMYQIEEFWDFGFVQVSTDGGITWTSLANEYTTSDFDPSAHPKVIDNVPGLTGSQMTIVNMEFDLSAYADQNILIGFRYVTDWATSEAGWFIDNVYLNDVLVSDGTDATVFKDISEIIPTENDFSVTFVGMKTVGKSMTYQVLNMKLDDATEDGMFELNSILKTSTSVVMLVTYQAQEGITSYAGYEYTFTYTNAGPK